ncbi:UNVERIFIED_CONTAM: Transposable element Tcb2 transposase [Trichonephila clavipes]
MAANDRTTSSRQLSARWSTTTGVLMSTSSIHPHLQHRGDCLQGCLYTGSPSRQTINVCVCNGLDNARPHVEKTARDFCSVQHMTLLPWPAYLLDTSSIEHVWDLVGRGLARDPRPAASKDELLLRIQAILNSPPQVDIQNLFDCIPRRIATFIAARGGYTKY